jgi:hypothetical protein
MATRRSVLTLIVTIAALGMVGAGPRARAATPCEASVHGELSRVEPKELVTTHTYTVNVTTPEPCATIRFTLTTTERISKTKVKVVKTKGEVRVRDGSVSRILNYDMPSGREMVKWEVKLTGCERCQP